MPGIKVIGKAVVKTVERIAIPQDLISITQVRSAQLFSTIGLPAFKPPLSAGIFLSKERG